jgi:hypothetical protein
MTECLSGLAQVDDCQYVKVMMNGQQIYTRRTNGSNNAATLGIIRSTLCADRPAHVSADATYHALHPSNMNAAAA